MTTKSSANRKPVGGVPLASELLSVVGVAAGLGPAALELAVEHAQGHVGQQRGCNAPLWRAGESPFELARLGHYPGPQERADKRQDSTVADPPRDLGHDDLMVEPVKARLDVRLDHPLVGRSGVGEVDDLGDGVLGAASRSVAVGRDVEVNLEDRLQHQLQGHLHHAVP
jgi:hypothetical protein